MSILHEHTLHPVTALEFYRDSAGTLYVLAGEGSFLKVFEAQTAQLVCLFEVFEGQTIHGIAVRENDAVGNGLQVVIWGGSSLALIGRRDFQQYLEGGARKFSGATCTVSDWTLDAAISSDEEDSCVLVTAHNTVIQARLASNSLSISVEEFESPSRSILYSANLLWESPSQILVAAGTVFGEIIVWQFSMPSNHMKGEGKVLFNFTGHEGSIFGVNISPPITHPDNSVGRLLASCSDDRTIRIWDITVRPEKDTFSRNYASPRETGFGNNGESSQSTCMAWAMGHASRIWRVKIITDEMMTTKPTQVKILSFGEDATTQQWSLLTEPTEESKTSLKSTGILQESKHSWSSQLVHTNMSSFHEGKHIWSAATHIVDGNRTGLATGGADGKIAFQEIKMSSATLRPSEKSIPSKDVSVEEETPQSSWDLEEVLGLQPFEVSEPASCEVPPPEEQLDEVLDPTNPEKKKKKKPKVKKPPRDAFNRYAFMSENTVLVTTSFGRIILGHIQETVRWEEVYLPSLNKDDLRSYAVVEGIPEVGHVYLAGANGNIFAYRGGTILSQVGSVQGKVADMFKIFNSQTSSYELLVTTLNGTFATLFSLNLTSDSTDFASNILCELPERFIVTSAAKIDGRLILGSRTGTLAVYDLEKGTAPLDTSNVDDNLQGDAITTILPLALQPSTVQDDKTIYILKTSRKGLYAIYTCSLTLDQSSRATEAQIRPVHNSAPPFSSMVEHAWLAAEQLFMYGFKGKNFVVWNETHQSEVMNIECGGAHRSYAYSPVREGGHFIYTKASKLYLHSRLLPSSKTVKRGGHGREIKSCAVSDDRSLIATGAEDTTIRIWRYDGDNDDSQVSPHNNTKSQLTCLAAVQKHTTGIQHLSWHGSNYLFSSGGYEEFFVWAVEEIPGFGIGIVCEATLPDQSEDRDLRIMSFDVSELPENAAPERTDKTGDGNEGGVRLLISLAYSDSTIRMYTYSKATGFALLATGRYTSSCLMQIRHVHVSCDDSEVYLVTAATDGNLALWKGSIAPSPASESQSQPHDEAAIQGTHTLPEKQQQQQLALLSTHKVHQSSIKALDIAISPSTSTSPSKSQSPRILIATGGDDNALGISLYHLSNPSTAPKSFIVRSAHSAAITGLCIVSDPESDSESELEFESSTRTGTKRGEAVRIVTSSNDQRLKEWDVRFGSAGEEGNSEAGLQIQVWKTGDVFTPIADVGDVAPLGGEAGKAAGGEGSKKKKKVLVVGNGMEVWRVASS